MKIFTFDGTLYTDRARFYVNPQEFSRLFPNMTPFLTRQMSLIKPKDGLLDAPEYKMFEYRGSRHWTFTLNDATPPSWSASGVPNDTLDDSVTIDNVTGFTMDSSYIGAVCEVWDSSEETYKGQVIITAVASATSVTMKAVTNETSATQAVAALADNDVFRVVTTAHGEETEAPEAQSDELSVVYNQAYLARTTVEVGKTVERANLRGAASERSRMRTNRARDHKLKIAKALYFGARPGGIGGVAHNAGGGTDATVAPTITDANGKKVRLTMGIWPAFRRYGRTSGSQRNYWEWARAEFNYNKWVDFWEQAVQYSPTGSPQDVYCGPSFMSHLHKIGAEGFVTSSGSREPLRMSEARMSGRLGINYRWVDTPHGPARFVVDWLLGGTPYAYDALAIAQPNCGLARYEPDQYMTNIKTDNNPRTIKDEFSSFLGLKFTVMESHHLLSLK